MATGRSRSEKGVRNTQAAFLADARPDFPTNGGQQTAVSGTVDPWKLTQLATVIKCHRTVRLGGGR